jgi:hypothetical protein
MEGEIIAAILSRTEEQKRSIELFLAGGGAKSYDDYCRAIGEYSSLQKVEDDIKDIEKRFLET